MSQNIHSNVPGKNRKEHKCRNKFPSLDERQFLSLHWGDGIINTWPYKSSLNLVVERVHTQIIYFILETVYTQSDECKGKGGVHGDWMVMA